MILLQLLLVGRKIVQIRQTEPVGVCPESVHRYAERFGLPKTQGNKNRRNSNISNFFLKFCIISTYLFKGNASSSLSFALCGLCILLQPHFMNFSKIPFPFPRYLQASRYRYQVLPTYLYVLLFL